MNRTILCMGALALVLGVACGDDDGDDHMNHGGSGGGGAGGTAGGGGAGGGSPDAGVTGDAGMRTATATIAPTAAGAAGPTGTVTFTQTGNQVTVMVRLQGLTAGDHGIHVHQNGSCDADAMGTPAGAAGGHWNPTMATHGAPGAGHRGDLGNITADAMGRGDAGFILQGATVGTGDAATDVVGHAFVVHMGKDDLMTDPAGNSGGRIGCGVIR